MIASLEITVLLILAHSSPFGKGTRMRASRQAERSSVVHCGHEISRQELEELQETVELFRGLSRWELAQTICEHLGG